MGLTVRYLPAVDSRDLRDDERHHATGALFAAALADIADASLGALLSHAKHVDSAPIALMQSVAVFKLADNGPSKLPLMPPPPVAKRAVTEPARIAVAKSMSDEWEEF